MEERRTHDKREIGHLSKKRVRNYVMEPEKILNGQEKVQQEPSISFLM